MADEESGFAPEPGPGLFPELEPDQAAPQGDLPWPPWLENLGTIGRIRAIVGAVAACHAAHLEHMDEPDLHPQHCTVTMAVQFLGKLFAEEAGPICEHDRCPQCDSPAPWLHPHPDGERQPCPHPWHSPASLLPVPDPEAAAVPPAGRLAHV